MSSVKYLSGLPRTGSTLLCSLLNQHPEVYASATSVLPILVEAVRNTFSTSEIYKSQANSASGLEERHKDGLRGLINGWGLGSNGRPVYIDKSRGWTSVYPILQELFESPKMVLTVCDMRHIYASMEKLYRQNPLNLDPVAQSSNGGSSVTIEDRVRTWSVNIPVGSSVNALKDLIDKQLDSEVLIIRMEDLVYDPQRILDDICKFYTLPSFTFKEPIVNVTPENDEILGIPGLHKVESTIIPMDKDYEGTLTRSLSNQIYDDYAWYNEYMGYER